MPCLWSASSPADGACPSPVTLRHVQMVESKVANLGGPKSRVVDASEEGFERGVELSHGSEHQACLVWIDDDSLVDDIRRHWPLRPDPRHRIGR